MRGIGTPLGSRGCPARSVRRSGRSASYRLPVPSPRHRRAPAACRPPSRRCPTTLERKWTASVRPSAGRCVPDPRRSRAPTPSLHGPPMPQRPPSRIFVPAHASSRAVSAAEPARASPDPRDFHLREGVALGVALSTRPSPLRPLRPTGQDVQPLRRQIAERPVRQCHRAHDAHIDADRQSEMDRRHDLALARKAQMPAERIARDRHVQASSDRLARGPEPDHADVRHVHRAPRRVELRHTRRSARCRPRRAAGDADSVPHRGRSADTHGRDRAASAAASSATPPGSTGSRPATPSSPAPGSCS